jgi:hypothetical protein
MNAHRAFDRKSSDRAPGRHRAKSRAQPITTQPRTMRRRPPKSLPRPRATGTIPRSKLLPYPADHEAHAFQTIGPAATDHLRNEHRAKQSCYPELPRHLACAYFVNAITMPDVPGFAVSKKCHREHSIRWLLRRSGNRRNLAGKGSCLGRAQLPHHQPEPNGQEEDHDQGCQCDESKRRGRFFGRCLIVSRPKSPPTEFWDPPSHPSFDVPVALTQSRAVSPCQKGVLGVVLPRSPSPRHLLDRAAPTCPIFLAISEGLRTDFSPRPKATQFLDLARLFV